jgi:hypothetical protein
MYVLFYLNIIMMKIKVLTYTLICFLIVMGMNILTSCNKQVSPKALITIVDGTGTPVKGATIKIFSDPTRYHGSTANLPNVGYVNADDNKIEYTATSDDAGQALFVNFKNECILNVSGKKGLAKNDTIRGEGAIILKMNQTVQETITLR